MNYERSLSSLCQKKVKVTLLVLVCLNSVLGFSHTPQYEVFLLCPDHHRPVSIVVSAKNDVDARSKTIGKEIYCPWTTSAKKPGKRWGIFPAKSLPKRGHTFKATDENITGVRPYPYRISKEKTIGAGVSRPAKPAETTAPAYLLGSKRFSDNTVTVSLRHGDDERTVLFPKDEVLTYDKLMRTAKATGFGDAKTALIGFLLAHGAGTKSLITGYLNAVGQQTDTTTVGEALSRLRTDGIIYKQTTKFKVTKLGEAGLYTVKTSQFMGEAVYGIPETTRLTILEQLKLDPHVQWWRPEILKLPSALVSVKTPIQYEWVRIIKPTRQLRSADDLKRYGPYPKDSKTPLPVTEKMPISLAYFLVKTENAEWLNPRKETVARAEEMFKYQTKEKLTRQAVLG